MIQVPIFPYIVGKYSLILWENIPDCLGKYSLILWEQIPVMLGNIFPQYVGKREAVLLR